MSPVFPPSPVTLSPAMIREAGLLVPLRLGSEAKLTHIVAVGVAILSRWIDSEVVTPTIGHGGMS